MPKISELTPAVALTGSESMPAVQSGATVKTTPLAQATYTFNTWGAANQAAARTAIGAGTVTSVNLASSTGLTASGGPITGSGSLTYTLSANLQAWHGLAPSAKQDADATLTALAGANWAANSLPIGSGADTVAQVTFAANTFPARSSTGNLVAKTITDAALSVLDDTTTAAMLTTLGAQPLDATLTALAGANWAANTLAIGSGADTVAQVSFAANQFPARSSSGNLVAKSITDFGLSLVDDADAATARTTLGLASGTYTPAYTSVSNVTATTVRGDAQYIRVGNQVTVSGQVAINATAGANTVTEVGVTLPVASNFTVNNQAGGSIVGQASGQFAAGFAYADGANDRVGLRFAAPAAGVQEYWYHFTYTVA